MAFDLIEVGSQEGISLLSEFRKSGFVMLLGSAISEWEPSNLPPGKALTSSVAELLSEPLSSPRLVKEWIEAAAFEHVMEGCPKRDTLGDNLLELFSPSELNPLHNAIGGLFADGVIEHIVTTNYDVNIESACRSTGQREVHVIVTELEAQYIQPLWSAIFKIHGSVEHDLHRKPGDDRTMIYTLGREGELPAWKRRILYRLVAGRRLIVCGYSGRDFEICPELTRLNAEIVWNTWRRDDLTANARRVLTATNGTALVGDMRKVLAQLQNPDPSFDPEPIAANRLTSGRNVKEKISESLSEWDLNLWRVRTLVGIGAASEGVRLANSMHNACGSSASREFDALLNLGRSQFHSGKYRQAIATYREAVALGERETQREWILQSRSDLFEALRCHGNWLRARKELSRMRAMITPSEFWAVALRSVLLFRYYYELAKGIKVVPWKVRKIRKTCTELLRVVVHHARNEQWLELQQAELWANRLDIRFSELYDGPLNPLPSKEGYKQLGYLIAESMAVRDGLIRRQGYTDQDISKMIDALSQAGAHAEHWKLVSVARRFKGGNLVSASQLREALSAWWRCEYTPLMRLFVTLFH